MSTPITSRAGLPNVPHRIAEGVAHLLEKNPAERSLFMLASMILGFLQYLLWLFYFGVYPHPLIDPAVLRQVTWVVLATVPVLAGIYALGDRYRSHPAAQRWLPVVMAQLYSATLLPIGYVLGQLSFTTGILLAGSPILGFILFDRRYVLWALGSALLLFAVVGVLTVSGAVTYGPLIHFDSSNPEHLAFHFFTQLYFGSPHLLAFLVIANIVMQQWKWRESDIRHQSQLDGLTGAFNRAAIFERWHQLVADVRRMPVSVLMLDLDHFKQVNDQYGHGVGDRVLQAVVQTLQATLRHDDALGRYGGEEFMVLLPHTAAERAIEVAERCRLAVEALRLEHEGRLLGFTVSIGVASGTPSDAQAADALVEQADQALYQAKHRGRNRVCAAPAVND